MANPNPAGAKQSMNDMVKFGMGVEAPDYTQTMLDTESQGKAYAEQEEIERQRRLGAQGRALGAAGSVGAQRETLGAQGQSFYDRAGQSYDRMNQLGESALNAPLASTAALRQGLDRTQRQTMAMAAGGRGNRAAQMRAALGANADARATTSQTMATEAAKEQASRYQTAGNLMQQGANAAAAMGAQGTSATSTAGQLGIGQAGQFANVANQNLTAEQGIQDQRFGMESGVLKLKGTQAEASADARNRTKEVASGFEAGAPGVQKSEHGKDIFRSYKDKGYTEEQAQEEEMNYNINRGTTARNAFG